MSCSFTPGLTEPLPPAQPLEGPHGPLAFVACPAPHPWLHVLISHGFGEHTGWWMHVARTLQAQGISAYLFDHYHHGRSAGALGDVPDYGRLVDGLRAVLERGVAPLRDGRPLVLLAHSNGALVALLALREALPTPVEGLVLCSPFLGMPSSVGRLGMALARVLRWISPGLRVPRAVRPWRLTGCRAIWPQYFRDPARFRSITVRFFLAMRRALPAAQAVRDTGGRPLLLLCAGREQVVSVPAMRAWFEALRAPDKERRVYPRLRHELFNETQWTDVLGDVVDWCRARFGAPGPREA